MTLTEEQRRQLIHLRLEGFDRELGGVHVSHGRKPVEKDVRKEEEPP